MPANSQTRSLKNYRRCLRVPGSAPAGWADAAAPPRPVLLCRRLRIRRRRLGAPAVCEADRSTAAAGMSPHRPPTARRACGNPAVGRPAVVRRWTAQRRGRGLLAEVARGLWKRHG